MSAPPRGPPPRKSKGRGSRNAKIPPPTTPPPKRGVAKSKQKSSNSDDEGDGSIPPPIVSSGPPPKGLPPGKGKPKRRQSAALLYKLQQKEGGTTPKGRPTTPEAKDNGEVVKSADWGVTPERERNKDKGERLSPRSLSPSPDDRHRSRKYSDSYDDSYEDSYDSYRREVVRDDSDYESEGRRGSRYTSSEDEGYNDAEYARRDRRYSDDASNSYDRSRYSPRSDDDRGGDGDGDRASERDRDGDEVEDEDEDENKDGDNDKAKNVSPSMYFANEAGTGDNQEEKEDKEDENNVEPKAKEDDGEEAAPADDEALAERTKLHKMGIKPEFFNGLQIPLILRELHSFLKAPVAGGLGIQVRCFIERDKSGVNKMAPVYTLYADHEDGSGRLLMCARKMWKSREPHYVISTNMDDLYRKREERSRHYMGKLRADASGSEYVLYDSGKSPKDLGMGWDEEGKSELNFDSDDRESLRRELCVISYSPPNKKGNESRTMEVAIPSAKGLRGEDGVDIWRPTSAKDSMPAHFARIRYQRAQNVLLGGRLFIAHLKESKYDPLSSCLVDFKERANCASVKNFQIVKSWPSDVSKRSVYHDKNHEGYGVPENYDLHQPILLQMGKVGKHCFNMDYQYPLSTLQAFGICLSRFDTTL